jgi:ubiquinone/menaquinone biosynthesis C-methylase UbiE
MKVEERFNKRVDNYIKYRPHYPPEVYDYLLGENVILPSSQIADVGCGTGISSELFLKHGHCVYGIDPSAQMLDAAVRYLTTYPGFKPIVATAENTTLPDKSADIIVCAQAFHWFNRQQTRTEFKRVLKPDGTILLMWNDRKTNTTDFLKVYEDFLQMFGTDYKEVNHKNVQDKKTLDSFFGENNYIEKAFYNFQQLDFAGLKGRVLSSSYMPDEQHKDYEYMVYCLKKIFQRYQENGTVKLEYDTIIYYGQLN